MANPIPLKTQSGYEKAFRAHVRLPGAEAVHNGLESVKWHAGQHWDVLHFPTRRQENWRFVELDPLLSPAYQPAQAVDIPLETLAPYFADEAATSRLVFVNGFFQPQLSQVSGLPAGVIVTELSQRAAQPLPDAFATGLADETDPFVLTNTMAFAQGAFIGVSQGVECQQPVQVLFVTVSHSETPQVAYPRVFVQLAQAARLSLMVSFVGINPGNGNSVTLSNGVVELFVGEHATLEYTHLQDETPTGNNLTATRAYLGRESEAVFHSFGFGGRVSRHALQVRMQGQGARCTLNGLSVLQGHSHVYDHTVIEHTEPNGTSDQLYKTILDGQTRSEFFGTIVIPRGAIQSDAGQLNRNLLLSEDARVFSRPQLMIDTDDVKCNHGATVGQLDEEQLFYLASRGLSYPVARMVLTYGFAEEMIDKVSVPSVRKQLAQWVYRNVNREHVGLSREEVMV